MTEFAAIIVVKAAAPANGRQIAYVAYVGMKALMNTAKLKTIEPIITKRVDLYFSRRGEKSAALKDPIARTVPSRPNDAAPLLKVLVVISALKIWKFNPNVAIKKQTDIVTKISGRALT